MNLRPRSGELAEQVYQRQVAEARNRQLTVSVERVTAPRREDGSVPRAEDRRSRAKREKAAEMETRREDDRREALAGLPPCPECGKTFSTKPNLLKHLR